MKLLFRWVSRAGIDVSTPLTFELSTARCPSQEWEQGAHLGSKVPDRFGLPTLIALNGRWEQGSATSSGSKLRTAGRSSSSIPWVRAALRKGSAKAPSLQIKRAKLSTSFIRFSASSADHFAKATSRSNSVALFSAVVNLLSKVSTSFCIIFSNAFARQKRSGAYPEDVLGDLFTKLIGRPVHDGIQAGHPVVDLIQERTGTVILISKRVQLFG
nr:hypothetical protein Iba_chr15dCG7410 [Ipomoea batatas]